MNSISTKKKNLVTNSNARKSRKKNHSQYGGSSRVLNKISDKRAQKNVPSEMSSISSQDFGSMSLEEKKTVLAARKKAIRTKKLEERKKKRKLKRERERLRTKKQKALKAQKLAREKAKKKKSLERKKVRKEKEEKEKAGVTPVQQMPMAPGMGMQQPYGMAQGQQTGMLPMGMSPAMIQGMALTGMGAPGQYQIAPGMTAIDAIDESSLEEMVSMLKNFEGNEYQQTARLILTEDIYITFNTAFKKLQQSIETVYKINKDTLDKAIKDRLDRDIEKRKKIHEKAIKAERRSRVVDEQRRERAEQAEENRKYGLFAVTKQSLIAQPAEAMVAKAKTERLNEQSIKKIIDFLTLFAKYPQLFILSKHMKDFNKPITIQDLTNQTESKSKVRKPNIILRFESSTTDLGNRLPKLGFLQLSKPLGGKISSLFTPKSTDVNQSGGLSRRKEPVDTRDAQLKPVKSEHLKLVPAPVTEEGGTQSGRRDSTNRPLTHQEHKMAIERLRSLGTVSPPGYEVPVKAFTLPRDWSPEEYGESELKTQTKLESADGDIIPNEESEHRNTIIGGQETADGDPAVTPPNQPETTDVPAVTPPNQPETAGGPEGPPPVSAVSGTKTQNNSEVNYRESLLELLKNQVYETLFLLLNEESINDIKSNKSDFSTFKNEVLTLKYKILNKEKYFVITRQNLEELPKENLPPSLVANNLNKCLILKNQDDNGIYFFSDLDKEENTIDLGKISSNLKNEKMVVVCKNKGGEKLTDSGFELGFANTVKTTIFSCEGQRYSLDHYILSLNYSLDDRKTDISPFLIDSNNTIIDTLNASEVEKQIKNMKVKLESVFNTHIKKQCKESFLSILDEERQTKLKEVIDSQPSTSQTTTLLQTGGNLKVSHNNGSIDFEGQSFSQQCFWISIVDWILVSQHKETLVNLQIRFPDDFGASLSNKDTFTKNRAFLLSAIKGLTMIEKKSRKYNEIIPNNQQTHVEGGENGDKKVIQEFVDRTGLYIDVFNINLKDNTKLLLPENAEDIQTSNSFYNFYPDGTSTEVINKKNDNRIFIVAYGNHFELITEYNNYNLLSNKEPINEDVKKIIYSSPQWNYAIYPEDKPNELIDSKNIDNLGAEVIRVLFISFETAIKKILNTIDIPPDEKQKQTQNDQLLNLGHQFGVMLEQLKNSKNLEEQRLYTTYNDMYYGEGGSPKKLIDGSLSFEITKFIDKPVKVID